MKIVIASLIMLQQTLFLAAPTAVTVSAVLLAACSTSDERADTRQHTRTEQRTEGRYERRRGED
jgi:hypothetical protein